MKAADLFYHCPHCCNARSIKVAVMATDFYERMVLDVLLHLFSGDEVVVSSVHLTCLSRACGV